MKHPMRMHDEARALSNGTPIRIAMGELKGRVWRKQDVHTTYCVGDYEPKLTDALKNVVNPGDLCYDVGAHHGWTSVLLALLAGETGYVVAFEPLAENVREIEANAKANEFADRIHVQPVAICDRMGVAQFRVDDDSKQGKLLEADTKAVLTGPHLRNVPCLSLDHYVFGLDTDPPDIIKIDVEGAEEAVLRGAVRLLTTRRPTLALSIHGEPLVKPCSDILEAAGYTEADVQCLVPDQMYLVTGLPRGAL